MLRVDFETRSAVDLKQRGLYVYAADASTDAICMAYAFDDGPVRLWLRGQPCPPDVAQHVLAGKTMSAWNAGFELAIWMHVMTPRYGWPAMSPEQLFDPMAQARALGLPGSLEGAAQALGTEAQKDRRGSYLISKLSKPQKNGLFCEDPALLQEFYAYCMQDVETERAVSKLLPPLRPNERALWILDQKINMRGITVDLETVQRAISIVSDEAAALKRRATKISGGAVTSLGEIANILALLREDGVEADDLKRNSVKKILARGVASERAKELLALRREAAKASVAKLKAMTCRTSPDGRARGLFRFCGADTGRWSGQGIQVQNLPRSPKWFSGDVAIDDLWCDDARETLRLCYGSPLSAISMTLRSLLTAAAGNTLLACDYANIEGRVLAWLAGEGWKLDAFRAYDAGTGPDIYELAYARAFGIPLEQVTDELRQLGKIMELALGFQGGVGAFASMAINYGVEVVDRLEDAIPGAQQVLTTAQADELKIAWREAHPNVVKFWYALERAAVDAVRRRGVVFRVGPHISFRADDNALWMRPPSGRSLCYMRPSIERRERFGKTRDVLVCWGALKKSRAPDGKSQRLKWGPWEPYGGLFAENACQAVARDILGDAMLRLEAHGFPVALHVHDEAVCEVPAARADFDEVKRIMSEVPVWADGLPLAVDGWCGERYRK